MRITRDTLARFEAAGLSTGAVERVVLGALPPLYRDIIRGTLGRAGPPSPSTRERPRSAS